MKSAQLTNYGNKDAVQIRDVSLSDPSSGKILVKVKAAGVNPVDWKIREGYMKQRLEFHFPAILGMDFSGTIDKIGSNVTGFAIGDNVYGQASVAKGGSGAFAEMAIADADTIAHKPKSLNFEQAAALPLVGVSAWQAIAETMSLTKGQKILIHGGAGGIGSIGIQLAKHLFAIVATTVSTDDIDFARQLGADKIIDYKSQKFEDVSHDYDAVFDTIGGDTYRRSFQVLKKGGIIVSMLEQPSQDLMNQYQVRSVYQFTQVNRDKLEKVADWVDQNNIKVNVEKAFPLDKAADALEYQKDVHPRGKIVLAV